MAIVQRAKAVQPAGARRLDFARQVARHSSLATKKLRETERKGKVVLRILIISEIKPLPITTIIRVGQLPTSSSSPGPHPRRWKNCQIEIHHDRAFNCGDNEGRIFFALLYGTRNWCGQQQGGLAGHATWAHIIVNIINITIATLLNIIDIAILIPILITIIVNVSRMCLSTRQGHAHR